MNSCFVFRIIRLRTISTKLYSQVTNSEYTAVYKFPYIRPAGLVNRLKFYQTAVTAFSVPTSLVLCTLNIISADTFLNTCVIGITGTLSLFLFGTITNKLIGFVYIKNDDKTAKISYIDFWGRRKDVDIPITDLVPLCDLPAVPTDPVFLTMRRFSSPEIFKINLKYGIVLEKTKFNTIFLQSM